MKIVKMLLILISRKKVVTVVVSKEKLLKNITRFDGIAKEVCNSLVDEFSVSFERKKEEGDLFFQKHDNLNFGKTFNEKTKNLSKEQIFAKLSKFIEERNDATADTPMDSDDDDFYSNYIATYFEEGNIFTFQVRHCRVGCALFIEKGCYVAPSVFC